MADQRTCMIILVDYYCTYSFFSIRRWKGRKYTGGKDPREVFPSQMSQSQTLHESLCWCLITTEVAFIKFELIYNGFSQVYFK